MAQSRRQRRQRNQRRSGVLLGGVAALLAGLLLYQVFIRSDDTGSTAAVSPGTPAASAPSGTTTTTAPLEPALPNVSFDELTLRDPFEPVINTGGSTSSTTTTTQPLTPTTTVPGTPTTTATTTPLQNPSGVNDVELVDITPINGVLTAQVRVGTTQYPVAAGQVFAGNYQLVSFEGETCANFAHADTPFRLCVGEQVLK